MGGIVSGVTNAIGGLFGGGKDEGQAAINAAQLQNAGLDKMIALQEPFRKAGISALPMLQQRAIGNPLLSEDFKMQQQNLQNTIAANSAAGGTLRGGAGLGAQVAGGNQLASNAMQQKINAQNALLGIGQNAIGQIGDAYQQQANNLGQAQIAAQQAATTAGSNLINAGLGAAGIIFSDERLKDNIKHHSKTKNPDINRYMWEWNKEAEKLGLTGNSSGYIAQEVERHYPQFVTIDKSGYKQINKAELDKVLS